MPTYHARNITVRLGSMPLAETTTGAVVLKKGEVAKRQSEAAEKKLLQTLLLGEQRVLFPGDPDGYELNWLGNAPFMQVEAACEFTTAMPPQSTGLYSSPRRSSTPEDNHLQALVLHVELSDKAFISGFTGKTHLKIEVLFNGQLSACSLVHTNDIRSGAKSLHQVFAGYRVDFLAERPWILIPPYTTADGGTRRFHKTITSNERWEQINAALLKEAGDRGTNQDGKLPPSAQFLHALATMQIPEDVKFMQKPGGRKFGIVDVIITAGIGSKLTTGTSYLKNPQRLKDPSFIMRSEAKTANEAAAVKVGLAEDATDELSRDMSPNLYDAEAESYSDAQHERSPKRREVSSRASSAQALSLCSAARIPHLSPAQQPTSQNDPSPFTSKDSARYTSPVYRSDGCKKPLSSLDRSCTDNGTSEVLARQNRRSGANGIFEEYHPPPVHLEPELPHAFRMYPTPFSLPLSDPVTANDMLGSCTVFTSKPTSRPISLNTEGHGFSLQQYASSTKTGTSETATGERQSSTYVTPTARRQATVADWGGPSTAMAAPYFHPTHLQQQSPLGFLSPDPVPLMPPNGSLNPLLQIPPLFGCLGTKQLMALATSPVTYQPPPMPPTAMFTVTSKPKRSASSLKNLGLIDHDKPRPGVLIKRLLITGMNGVALVDHRWKDPRRVIVNQAGVDRVSTGDRDDTLGSDYAESRTKSRTRKQGACQNNTARARSQTNSPTKAMRHYAFKQNTQEYRRNSTQGGQNNQSIEVSSLPYLKKHQGSTDEEMPVNPDIIVPDQVGTLVPAPLLVATSTPTLTPMTADTFVPALQSQPIVPQRRTVSRNAVHGIQGPKAATFLLDDPEEVLREASRMRRSRSPTKPVNAPTAPSATPLVHRDSTAGFSGPGNSSPLSSVPSSPVPGGVSKIVAHADTLQLQIPQLDGSPDCMVSTTSPSKLPMLSPTKLSLPTPKFDYPALATPQSSASPELKKRKALHRSPTKPPGSLDRLKTADNPPLNDDCVIAFAESRNKDDGKGVLRQVKGERQGVFKEEYVTLAVRFFIAGD